MINGSYNSFLNQVGYCKLQGYDTHSRSSSNAPPMFVDGRIRFGVGLSNVEFQDRTSQCGRCINITHIENFFKFNDELTEWDENLKIQTPFTVFVMDQCKDAICTTKFLDFDIYNPFQPVAHGNPWNLDWTFVPCPVNEDEGMELLMCLGPNVCNVHDDPHPSIVSMREDAVASSYWYCHVRNHRVPIVDIGVSFRNNDSSSSTQIFPLKDDVGWRWMPNEMSSVLESTVWTFVFRSMEGEVRTFDLDWDEWTHKLETNRVPSFRGGLIIPMDIQV